jgi:hypothetical protein
MTTASAAIPTPAIIIDAEGEDFAGTVGWLVTGTFCEGTIVFTVALPAGTAIIPETGTEITRDVTRRIRSAFLTGIFCIITGFWAFPQNRVKYYFLIKHPENEWGLS